MRGVGRLSHFGDHEWNSSTIPPHFSLNPMLTVLVREGDNIERVGFIQEGTCTAFAQVPNTRLKSAQVS